MSALTKLVAVALSLAAGGCVAPVPIHVLRTPHVVGTVVDESTKAPVPQARLHWAGWDSSVAVFTSQEGRFDFPAISNWTLVGTGQGVREQTLEISAPGYESTKVEFHSFGAEFRVGYSLRPHQEK